MFFVRVKISSMNSKLSTDYNGIKYLGYDCRRILLAARLEGTMSQDLFPQKKPELLIQRLKY